jgi:hypothetical protein
VARRAAIRPAGLLSNCRRQTKECSIERDHRRSSGRGTPFSGDGSSPF